MESTLRNLRAGMLTIILVVSAAANTTLAQEPPPQEPTKSVVDAARNAREHQANSSKPAPIITNDDLRPLPPSTQLVGSAASVPADTSLAGGTSSVVAAPTTPDGSPCTNPNADALKIELQETQDQRDQIHEELSAQPAVISGGNLDTQGFVPGGSGLSVGSKPLLEAQPEDPARITAVALDEKIAALKKNLQVACDSPEASSLQKQLDAADQQLAWAQRQLSLDQSAFYSNPSYAQDTAGQTKLDAEKQQVDALQAERDRLKEQLTAVQPNPQASDQSSQW